MKLYWKVHKNNFYYFIKFIKKKYKYHQNINDGALDEFIKYYSYKYIYLCVNTDGLLYRLTFCRSRKWLEVNKWENMGEFYSRKDKLIKLDKLSKL